jgi:hypothetical protein
MKKKMTLKICERLALIACGAVLLLGVVVYPATKKANAYRSEQIDILDEEIAYLEDLQDLLNDSGQIKQENATLRSALKGTDGLLFPPMESKVMFQTRMVQLLNEMGPDLELEVDSGRSSVRDPSTKMNLVLKGRGRYPEILNFMNKLEMHRPVIIVDYFMILSGKPKKDLPKGKKLTKEQIAKAKSQEPSMSLRMALHINCLPNEEEVSDDN